MTVTAGLQRESGPAWQVDNGDGDAVVPLVSIVMANYNAAPYIEAALHSVLSQSLRNIEVIVADDASTDDSADQVALVASCDARVRLLRAPANEGPAAARNRCLDVARGRWIAIMDSDDMMHPQRLEFLVAAAERDGADMAADDLLIFDEDPAIAPSACLGGKAAASASWIGAADYVRANILFSGGQSLGYLKPLIRTGLIEDSGLRYDPTLRIAEDYDFILRLLVRGARLRVYPQLWYFYRKHSQSISHRLSRRTLEPMLAAHDRMCTVAGSLDERLNAAMAKRRSSLQQALDFDDLVSALKERDWRGAAVRVIRRPQIAALLRGVLADRLHRFAARRASESVPLNRQICVLARQLIAGNTNASSAYLFSICTALRQAGCDVHLLCLSPALFRVWPWLLLGPDAEVFQSVRLRGSLRIGRLFIATDPPTMWRAVVAGLATLACRLGIACGPLSRPAPYAVSQAWTRQDMIFIARYARTHSDVVIADNAFMIDAIPYTLRPDAHRVVVMNNLFSTRSAQFNRVGAAELDCSIERHVEMALLGKADTVLATQADDAAAVRRYLPAQHVIVAPIGISPVAEPQPGRDRSLLFVGSDTAANVFGLRWFLETIWPIVRGSVPDATLRIAGSVCGMVGSPPDGVRLLGTVRELGPLYREAGVVILPMLARGSLQTKLIEALGQGKAVVATGVTLQGVQEATDGIVVAADDPASFAAAVTALLTDEELRMAHARAALDLARKRFSPSVCYAELLAFVSAAPRLHPGPAQPTGQPTP